MATYRCNDCGTPIFTGDNLSGALKLTCPNRQCISRRTSPPKKQEYVFGGTGAQRAQGIGQKALRGSNRRG